MKRCGCKYTDIIAGDLRELRRGGQDPEVSLRPAPRVPQREGSLQVRQLAQQQSKIYYLYSVRHPFVRCLALGLIFSVLKYCILDLPCCATISSTGCSLNIVFFQRF